MVKPIKPPKRSKPRKIIISTELVINLARIKKYGEELFGKTVSNKLVKEIRQKIALLSKQPDANPKNRFLADISNGIQVCRQENTGKDEHTSLPQNLGFTDLINFFSEEINY